ncbi:hypothetical protein ACFOVU_20070 [Nocardiopsis sediminis]|uniref:Uncharacterized protein n=1 Tax=Nocardiopsis sediminis TaxID=1778267 RepID=A0ABV8FT29_9ACTN
MDYVRLIHDIQRRPGSYGLSGGYREYVAFIMGCDAGNEWGLLAGFPQWLALKHGFEANLAWPEMISQISGRDEGGGESETLFQNLRSFLDEKKGPHFSSIIISNYLEEKMKKRGGR